QGNVRILSGSEHDKERRAQKKGSCQEALTQRCETQERGDEQAERCKGEESCDTNRGQYVLSRRIAPAAGDTCRHQQGIVRMRPCKILREAVAPMRIVHKEKFRVQVPDPPCVE